MPRLDYSSIFKRSSSLNSSTAQSKDSKRLYEIFNAEIEESINPKKVYNTILPKYGTQVMNAYIDSMCDKDNASKYYYDGLKIIEKLTENEFDDKLIKEFTNSYSNRVLPYVDNLEGVIECTNRYNIPNPYRNIIIEKASNYILADKILTNHQKISKRFNIEHEVKLARIKRIDSIIENCCSMIDTYNIQSYQKFNMCIEEIVFLLEKNGIEFDEDNLVASILEYFLINNSSLSRKDLDGYLYVLRNNKCVEETVTALKILNENNFDNNNIKNTISNFLTSTNRTIPLFESNFKEIIENTSIQDIKNNYSNIVEFTRKLYFSDLFEDKKALLEATNNVLLSVFDKCQNICTGDEYLDITRNDIFDFINTLKITSNSIPIITDDDSLERKGDYKELLKKSIEEFTSLTNLLYDKNNLKILEFVNEDSEETVPVQEFKIFKFNNIIKATFNLDKYLKAKGKKINDKIKKGIKKVKSILFDENGSIDRESIYNFIGEDNKVDICAYQIETLSEKDITEVQDELIEICNSFNNELQMDSRYSNIGVYYILNSCIAEIHVKDKTNLSLTESDINMVNIAENPSTDIYIEQLAIFDACNQLIESYELKGIDEIIVSTFSSENINMSLEAYDVAMDALSLLGASKYQIDSFTENFSMYRNSIINESESESLIINENKYIKSIYSNWKPIDVPYDIQVEAATIFLDIMNEASTPPKVTKVKVGGNAVKSSPTTKTKPITPGVPNKDKKEYNPSENISNKLNNLKIYLHGLKLKAKEFNQKEKEISRNLDAAYNNFSKSVKNALISDRREAIIKGSVIPSFSKSLKIAISLGALGLATQNPVVPLAAALGGLAASKRLTKKERILLLDEIETELEVLDKEIANADAKNQIKKYRALLQYKKDLQRQYQRIKYNVRVGKDILPNSAAGFKERN